MQPTVEPLFEPQAPGALAEVIPLQKIDTPSFYQRKSGALPKIGDRSQATHRRASLPRPENDDHVAFMDRIRSLFNR